MLTIRIYGLASHLRLTAARIAEKVVVSKNRLENSRFYFLKEVMANFRY